MRALIGFFRRYPAQSALTLLALLLAGIAEGIGLSAFLPLLSIAIKRDSGVAAPGSVDPGTPGVDLEVMLRDVFASLGIEPTIGILLSVIVVGITAKNLLILVARKQIGYTAARVATDLRLALLRAILDSRWSYFLHQPAGLLANSMAIEVHKASQGYVFATTMITQMIHATVYTTLALLVSWKATVVAIGAGVLVLGVSYHLVKMTRRAGKRQTKLLRSMLSRLTDTLQSVKPLKAMARGDLADAVLTAETAKLNQALRREVFSKAMLSSVQEPMFVVLIAVGIYAALEYWEVPLATVMVLVLLLGRMLNQIGKVQGWYQKMIGVEPAARALQETIREADREREISTGTLPPKFESEIRLDAVRLAYDSRPVLNDLSIRVPAGRLTTLIGRSGAGKTTIIDLVTGLLQPDSGVVLVDGQPLAELDLRQWRRVIGYVPQENLLLHDSIYSNVTLGDPALGEADAEYALRAAGAWGFVQEMPQGMNSLVGERGAKLSGGQRQRIMIARALAHRPKLLILDEATSALDPRSEKAICETLAQLRGDLTVLAISHQSAIVEVSDQVYRLQDGAAVLQPSAGEGDSGGAG